MNNEKEELKAIIQRRRKAIELEHAFALTQPGKNTRINLIKCDTEEFSEAASGVKLDIESYRYIDKMKYLNRNTLQEIRDMGIKKEEKEKQKLHIKSANKKF